MSVDYLKNFGKAKDAVQQLASTPISIVVQDFANQAIEEMRANVPQASKTLQSSIGFEFQSEGSTITVRFMAEDYWDFVNAGVNGVEQSSGAMTNQFGSTYNFQSENPSQKMVDAFSGNGSMQNWMAAKGIQAPDGDYESLAYVLARSVKRRGIKPTLFVDKALSEEKLKAFEIAIIEAFEKMI